MKTDDVSGASWPAGNAGKANLDKQKSWVSLAIPGGCDNFRDGCSCAACYENIDDAWREALAHALRRSVDAEAG